ncbi:MAG: hypothetical protein AAF479_05260 [Pseudomonadota bacterium]
MLLALILGVAAAAFGWRKASRRGGNRADCLQYAAAHGIPAFLITMLLFTIAVNLGVLG